MYYTRKCELKIKIGCKLLYYDKNYVVSIYSMSHKKLNKLLKNKNIVLEHRYNLCNLYIKYKISPGLQYCINRI